MFNLTKKTKPDIGKLSKNRLRHSLFLACLTYGIGDFRHTVHLNHKNLLNLTEFLVAFYHILNCDSIRNYPERDKWNANEADFLLIFPNGITGREIQVCGRGSRENLRPQACPGSLSRKLPNGIRIYGKVGRV